METELTELQHLYANTVHTIVIYCIFMVVVGRGGGGGLHIYSSAKLTYLCIQGKIDREENSIHVDDRIKKTSGPVLLTWFNFNPSMDKLSHA